jgi:hypothetical protein
MYETLNYKQFKGGELEGVAHLNLPVHLASE